MTESSTTHQLDTMKHDHRAAALARLRKQEETRRALELKQFFARRLEVQPVREIANVSIGK
jgi:hypothetical protein